MAEKKEPTVLLAEDENSSADLFRVALEKAGFIVRRVEDGEGALEAVRKEKPDIIVMDLMMPRMDGFTAATHLAAEEATRGIPIVVISAKAGMKDACEMSPNIMDFLAKPFAPERLAEAVKNVLEGKRNINVPVKPPPPEPAREETTAPEEKEVEMAVPSAAEYEAPLSEPAPKPAPEPPVSEKPSAPPVPPAKEERGSKEESKPPAAPEPAPDAPIEDLMEQRRSKLQKYRDTGLNPYPTRYDVTAQAGAVLQRFESLGTEAASEELVAVAGRLMTRRDMGKIIFAHVQDRTGRIQVYLRKDELGSAFAFFKEHVDLGDHVGFAGTPFRTKTGEITIRAASWRLLSKTLRPPPEKFHGMTSVEERYRRREVDLFSNEDVRERFLHRRSIVSTLRRILEGKGFVEVETPMMQSVPGGAAARPFMTHHEALDQDLYLRIAPELYLKRLLVGGLERVFEIGRAFRNEGIDTRHNPEFTILECYQAYTDYKGMMELAEELIKTCAAQVRRGTENLVFEYRGKKADMDRPFARLNLVELFKEQLQLDYFDLCRTNGWRAACGKLNLKISDALPDHKCFEAILDEKILPVAGPAAFLFGYPAAFSPLAKQNADHPEIAERFELFLCGEEVGNAYSEQNDPDVQRKHFEAQAAARKAGDAEAMPADEEFLTALEHGMPPAGGLGIGVDRLTMILTGVESIREVILFPLLRPS
jgi:lysyl-tRNA synthetase class 2